MSDSVKMWLLHLMSVICRCIFLFQLSYDTSAVMTSSLMVVSTTHFLCQFLHWFHNCAYFLMVILCIRISVQSITGSVCNSWVPCYWYDSVFCVVLIFLMTVITWCVWTQYTGQSLKEASLPHVVNFCQQLGIAAFGCLALFLCFCNWKYYIRKKMFCTTHWTYNVQFL